MDYQRIYTQFIADRKGREPALLASGEYKEVHHILPRSLGGTDEPENLVALTAEDHLRAHLLLAKIYGRQMWLPLFWVIYGAPKAKGVRRIPTRVERKAAVLARQAFRDPSIWRKGIDAAAVANKGENNPMHRLETKKKVQQALREHWENGTGPASLEAREKLRLAHTTPEYLAGARDRVVGENNPGFGKPKEKNSNARKVRCIETGRVFDSAKAAAEWCGVEVNRACSMGIRAGGYHWERVGEPHPRAKVVPPRSKEAGYAKRRRQILCVDTGEVFECARAAAEFFNLKSYSEIHNIASGRGKTYGGYRWAYA